MANAPLATVYGGSGFLGRYIVPRLAKAGYTVRVAVRSPSRANFLKTSGVVGQVVPVGVRIGDAESVLRAADGASVLINLTGILFESGSQTFDRVQAAGPANVGAAARAVGAERVIHVSAIGADLQSSSKYAQTKAAGEDALFDRFPDATVLRPSIVFGAEDNFFNQFAQMARTAPALPLIGGGNTKFQPVFVGDIADAVDACLADSETKGRLYELGGPEILTFRECLERMMHHTRRKRPLVTLPWSVANAMGAVMQKLPKPVITQDQVKLLKTDNVVAEGALTLGDLGLEPTALDTVLPGYLTQYRKGGHFSASN